MVWVLHQIWGCNIYLLWTPILTKSSLVIVLVCSLLRSSEYILAISEIHHYFFIDYRFALSNRPFLSISPWKGSSIFFICCMKLGYHKGTKVTKNLWGSQMRGHPHIQGIWCFCPYLCIRSSKFSEILYV